MSRTTSESITPFMAMAILEKAQALELQGKKVIHLEIGQPDFDSPACVKEAAIKAIRDGRTAYTHSLGELALREAIAEYYHNEYGVEVSPEQIIVNSGSSPAMLMLFSALCNAGDEIITSNPTYACYKNVIREGGGNQRAVLVKEEESFQFAPSAVKGVLNQNTRAILLNSPSNPAGTIMPREHMQEICSMVPSLADARGNKKAPTIISDEIYHGLSYEGKAASALEFTDNCYILDGFSKRYAMTGWRLGWLVAPKHMMPIFQAMQQNFYICACSISQWAGVAAIKEAAPDVEHMVAEYNKRRLLMIDLLRSLGFGVKSSPAGAFYVFANASHINPNSLELSLDILEKAGVGVAPGADFGTGGEGYLRFCYANSVENIQEAMARLKKYLENR